MKVAIDTYTNQQWQREFFHVSEPGIGDWSITLTLYRTSTPGHVYLNQHIGGASGWGRTPSGGGTVCTIKCNEHLF